MSLLGIDAGTTGCKATVFTTDGRPLASAYEEYDIQRPRPGEAELDTAVVWDKIKRVTAQAAAAAADAHDPISALAVSSLGEAVVPVDRNRRFLAPSILNFDVRGEEYLPALRAALPDDRLYRINGNPLGNHYGLTKLLWIRDHQPDLYRRTDKFLLWSSFVAYMFGAEPTVDYSLANRTLLFDVDRHDWSDELVALAGLDKAKLPRPVPSGAVIGTVCGPVAEELGLPPGIVIAAGSHDQCANAVGCGVIGEGLATFGMGTYTCITPAFSQRPDPARMLAQGLNTEHHAAPGKYVSFLYNQGGSMVKWFRDTFALRDKQEAAQAGRDIYGQLIAEAPDAPSSVLVLPHFSTTGPPRFIADSSGVIVGLKLETTRGDILKGIIESIAYYLRDCVESLAATGVTIDSYRAVGGGSRSDRWIQISADILGRPMVRPAVTEAGALGAAIMAGVGSGVYPSYEAAVAAMVRLDRAFEPDPTRSAQYTARYEQYRQLGPLMEGYLRGLVTRG